MHITVNVESNAPLRYIKPKYTLVFGSKDRAEGSVIYRYVLNRHNVDLFATNEESLIYGLEVPNIPYVKLRQNGFLDTVERFVRKMNQCGAHLKYPNFYRAVHGVNIDQEELDEYDPEEEYESTLIAGGGSGGGSTAAQSVPSPATPSAYA